MKTFSSRQHKYDHIKRNNCKSKNLKPEIYNDNLNPNTLLYNDIIITSRIEDNFINATLLCQAGNKRYNKNNKK